MPLRKDDIEKHARKSLRYFSHDADAMNDEKLKRLKKRFGWSGYGRWWHICEILANNEGHRISFISEIDKEILSDDLEFESIDDLSEFLQFLCDVRLLINDDGLIYSERMNANANYFGTRRASGKKGGKARDSR